MNANMKAYIILSSFLFCAATAEALTLTVTPGAIAGDETQIPASETEIIISGEINAKDLAALAAIRPKGAAPTILDLSDATIASTRYINSSYLGYTYLPAAELPSYILSGTSFIDVKMPASLTAIGDGAFAGSALTNADIPASVVSVGDYAFYDCKDLTAVSAGSSLKSLGKGCFGNCVSLKDVDFAGCGFHTLPERAFAGCVALTSMQMPADLESVGAEAFAGTGITTLSLSAVRKLEPFALSGMPKLESAALSADAKQGEGLFANNSKLEKVSGATADIPDAYAAGCTSLDSNTLTANAISIGKHALASAPIEEMTLSPTLLSVDKEAFSGMTALRLINAYALGSNVPYATDDAFDGIDPSKIDLLVAKDDQDAWKASPQWSRFNITADPSTSSDKALAETGINIRLTTSSIVITSDQPLTEVSVYLLDGQTVVWLRPNADKVSVPLPSAAGLIVKAATAEAVKTAKLLLH